MAGAGAQRSGRFQSASVAVTATMIAMLFALGTSIVVSERTARTGRTALATTASQSRSAPTAGAPRSGTPTVRAPRPATGAGQARAGEDGPASTPTAPSPGSTARTEAGGPPSTSVNATGNGGTAAPAAASPISFHTAAPGRWSLRVETKSTSLLGQPNEERTNGAFAVDAAEGMTQHLRVESGALAIKDERVSYADGARRLGEVVVWTGSGEPLTFTSTEGLLDLPPSFRSGDTWRWSAATADGKTAIDADLETVRRRTTTVGDDEVETIESTIKLTFSGDRSGSLARRVWFAPELGVAVRIEERLSVTNPDGQLSEWSSVAELVQARPDPEPVLPPTTTTTTTSGEDQPGG